MNLKKLIEFSFSHRLESPNVKHHWGTVVNRNKKLKKRVLMAWLTIPSHLKTFLIERPFYCVKIIRLSPHKMDSDNFIFACKYIRDILADLLVAGLGYGQADADDKFMKFEYDQQKSKEHLIKIEIYKND